MNGWLVTVRLPKCERPRSFRPSAAFGNQSGAIELESEHMHDTINHHKPQETTSVSYQFIAVPTAAIERISEISDKAFKLFVYLVFCHNRKTGQCNPSASRCAKALNLSIRHIYKLRRELAEAEWVSFDYGAATFLIETLSNRTGNPVQPDRVDNNDISENPVQPDREPCPTGQGTLSNRTVAYKEEPEERTRRKNQSISAGAAPRRDSSAKKKKISVNGNKSLKSPHHSHPCVVAYRQITDYKQINAEQATAIAEKFNGAERPPDKWVKFLRELAMTGYRHFNNVRVLLLAFGRYELQGIDIRDALDWAWREEKGENQIKKPAPKPKRTFCGNCKSGWVRTDPGDEFSPMTECDCNQRRQVNA